MEARLRQSLAYMSDDLRNLTLLDLQESKWPIRRRVFLVLFSLCRSLADYNDELLKIAESREEEVAMQRSQNVPREQRKESEMFFRAQFVRVVCNGLESIRWPPALEAFADPLVDLLNDKKTFLNAVNYIIQIGGLARQGTVPKERPASPKIRPSSATQKRQQHEQGTPSKTERRRPTWDSSPLHPSDNTSPSMQHSPSSACTMDTSHISDASSMRRLYGALSGKARRIPNTASWTDADIDDRHDAVMENGNNTSLYRDARAGNPPSIKTLGAALESLQQQNSTLSRQLKMAYQAAARRERAERSLEIILAELAQAVGQVAALSSGAGDDHTLANSGNGVQTTFSSLYIDEPKVDPSFVTEAEDAAFQAEVMREEREQAEVDRERKGLKVGGRGVSSYTVSRDKDRDKIRGTRGDKNGLKTPVNTTSNQGGTGMERRVTSALLWRQTLETIESLRSQWTEAMRDVRSSFMAPLSQMREDSREFLRKSSGDVEGKEGPALVRLHRLLGVTRPLSFPRSSLGESEQDRSLGCEDDGEIWLDLPRVQQLQSDLLAFAEEASAFAKDFSVPSELSSKWSTEHGFHGTHGDIARSRVGSRNASAGESRKITASGAVKKGIKKGKKKSGNAQRPGVSVFEKASNIVDSGDFSQPDSVASLPRDGNDSDGSSSLSDYREGRRGMEHSYGHGSRWTSGGPDIMLVHPKDIIAADYSRSLSDKAAALTMHLAALSPIAPLALDSPRNSSSTGLHLLLKECNSLFHNSSGRHIDKRTKRILLEAGDRARSEMHGLASRLARTEAELRAYHRLAREIQPVFRTFESNAANILQGTWTEVSGALTAIDEIVIALDRAEAGRVGSGAVTASSSNGSRQERLRDDTSYLRSDDGSIVTRDSSASGKRSNYKRGRGALDVLCEGAFGEEVATLVRSLRTHQEVLRELQKNLFSAKKSLQTNAAKEISALHAAKERIREKVLPVEEHEIAHEGDFGSRQGRNDSELSHGVDSTSMNRVDAPRENSAEKASRKGGGRPMRLEDRPPFEL